MSASNTSSRVFPGNRDVLYPRLSNPSPIAGTSSSSRPSRKRSRRACLNCRARKVRCDVDCGFPCLNCRLDRTQCVVSRHRRNRKIHSASNVEDLVVFKPGRITTETKDYSGSLSPAIAISSDTFDPVAHLPSFIQSPSAQLSATQMRFLHVEGALSLPTFDIQQALVEAYAEFAYPYMPVVHLQGLMDVLYGNATEASSPFSLLLYQAILFPGCAFVDTKQLIKLTGGSCRKSARMMFARRVTLLYDLSFESSNPMTYIQVALIMSSSSDIAHGRKDSWYWMGQALSLAYAIGLNHDPSSEKKQDSSSEIKLRKRLWWSCYMRDRFLALGLGRPTRIKDRDCTVLPLEIHDFDFVTLTSNNWRIPTLMRTLFSDEIKQTQLAEICIARARLSQLIESVTRIQEAYDRSESEIIAAEVNGELEQDFAQAEAAVEVWKYSLPLSCLYRPLEDFIERADESIAVHRSHLHMAYQTLRYTLHRPRFLPTSPRRGDPTARFSSDISGARVFSSAIQISRIAKELQQRGLVKYLSVSGITVIFPALAVSLLEMRSRSEAQRMLAAMRFKDCLEAMETLKGTYSTAEVAIEYLKKGLKAASIDPRAMISTANLKVADCEGAGENHHPAFMLEEAMETGFYSPYGFEDWLSGAGTIYDVGVSPELILPNSAKDERSGHSMAKNSVELGVETELQSRDPFQGETLTDLGSLSDGMGDFEHALYQLEAV